MDEREQLSSQFDESDLNTEDLHLRSDETLDSTVAIVGRAQSEASLLDDTLDETLLDSLQSETQVPEALLVTQVIATQKPVPSEDRGPLDEFDSDAPEPPGVCARGDEYFAKTQQSLGTMSSPSAKQSPGLLRSIVWSVLWAALGAAGVIGFLYKDDPQYVLDKMAALQAMSLAEVPLAPQTSEVIPNGFLYECLVQYQQARPLSDRGSQSAVAGSLMSQSALNGSLKDCAARQFELGAVIAMQKVIFEEHKSKVEYASEQSLPIVVEEVEAVAKSVIVVEQPKQIEEPVQIVTQVGPELKTAQAEPLKEQFTQSVDIEKTAQIETSVVKNSPQGPLFPIQGSQPQRLVKDLQWRLFKQRLYSGDIDGVYSKATDDALKAFLDEHPEFSTFTSDLRKLFRAVDSISEKQG